MAKVLPVDDDVDLVEMYEAVLTCRGRAVTAAYSAEEARAALRGARPDVVVLDVMMETADAGFHLGREIHEHWPELPLFFLSSVIKGVDKRTGIPNVFEADASWCKVVKFIDKPFKAEKLAEEIDKAVAEREA